jgi:hypothetical protein
LTERGGGSFDEETAAVLLSSVNQAILASDLLGVIAGSMGYSAVGCADGAREVREQVKALLNWYRTIADSLSLYPSAAPGPRLSAAALRQAELTCLRRWQADAEAGRGAMAVVMAGEWAESLAHLEADLEGAVNTAVDAARRPWWR